MSEEIRGYRIHGQVQGVGFRYWTQHKARALGLAGYVRNLPDGSVEVAAAGDSNQLRQLEQLLSRGPTAARVERVDPFTPTSPLPPTFEITR